MVFHQESFENENFDFHVQLQAGNSLLHSIPLHACLTSDSVLSATQKKRMDVLLFPVIFKLNFKWSVSRIGLQSKVPKRLQVLSVVAKLYVH